MSQCARSHWPHLRRCSVRGLSSFGGSSSATDRRNSSSSDSTCVLRRYACSSADRANVYCVTFSSSSSDSGVDSAHIFSKLTCPFGSLTRVTHRLYTRNRTSSSWPRA